jgi:dynein heavy chain 1, cytosolic
VSDIAFSHAAQDEVTFFLNGGGGSDERHSNEEKNEEDAVAPASLSGGRQPASRLFVWLPTRKPNSDQDDDHPKVVLEASCHQLPKQSDMMSSIVFCRRSGGGVSSSAITGDSHSTAGDTKITHASQIYCVTLQQSSHPIQEDTKSNEDTAVSSSTTITSSVLESLQMYTRECFLPTLTSLLSSTTSPSGGSSASTSPSETLDLVINKMRELDVAIVASSRSARLPHIVLNVNERINAAVAKKQSDKIDWDELQLRECFDDDSYLNTIQSGVSQWIDQIRQITVLPSSTINASNTFNDISPVTTATEEVTFWTQLSTELQSIQDQLHSPGVEITVAMLRETKRFVATLALENNTGLEQAMTMTNDVNQFIKPYPITQLQTAAHQKQFDPIAMAMNAIFDHIPKIRQSRYYTLDRCAALLSATTIVLRDSMLSVLQEQSNNSAGGIIFLEYKEYENKIRFPTLDVFVQFDDRYAEWRDFILDQGRRRKIAGLNRVLDKMTLHHLPLKERLDQIHEFRFQHEKLREVVHAVLREDEPEAIQQVDQTPRHIFAPINVLDLSSAGTNSLNMALEDYDIQMDALEERLARLLRDKLQACRVRV